MSQEEKSGRSGKKQPKKKGEEVVAAGQSTTMETGLADLLGGEVVSACQELCGGWGVREHTYEITDDCVCVGGGRMDVFVWVDVYMGVSRYM